MKDFSHMINKKYGQLTVTEVLPPNNANRKVIAVCECGKTKEYQLTKIRIGATISCGCYAKKASSLRNSTHGGSQNNSLYEVWHSMKTRCLNNNSQAYKHYGGRGIAVCDTWKKDFKCFSDWALLNGYSKGLQLDRINNEDGYSPLNCRFVSSKVNNNNTSRNRVIQFNGMNKTLSQWSDFIGVNYTTLHQRLKKGWGLQRALSN